MGVKAKTGVPVKALDVFCKTLEFPRNIFLAPMDGYIVRFGADHTKESLVQQVDEYAPHRRGKIQEFQNTVKQKILSGEVDTVLLPVLFEPGKAALNLPYLKEKYHAALVVVHVTYDNGIYLVPEYFDSYAKNETFEKPLRASSKQLKRMLTGKHDQRGDGIPKANYFPNE